jgi:hypothetical protein
MLLPVIRNSAVTRRTPPSVTVMTCCATAPFRSNLESRRRVAMVAGTLPIASRETSIQSTVRAAAWTIVPVALVEAANSRSVPTAVLG